MHEPGQMRYQSRAQPLTPAYNRALKGATGRGWVATWARIDSRHRQSFESSRRAIGEPRQAPGVGPRRKVNKERSMFATRPARILVLAFVLAPALGAQVQVPGAADPPRYVLPPKEIV